MLTKQTITANFAESTQRRTPVPNGTPPLIALIDDGKGSQAVSARELHRFVESSERFSKWIERMLEYGFESGVDYTLYQKVHPLNKQTFKDFALTLDTAKEVSMIQRNEKGRMARRYFIECEKRLQEIVSRGLHVPQTGIIQLINDQTDKLIKLERKIDLMKRDNVRYFKAKLVDWHQRREQKITDEFIIERDKWRIKFLMYLDRYCKYGTKSPDTVLAEVYERFQNEYGVYLQNYQKRTGESKLDLVYRIGYGQQIWEVIAYRLLLSSSVGMPPQQ